jgi:bacteriorhodopsin
MDGDLRRSSGAADGAAAPPRLTGDAVRDSFSVAYVVLFSFTIVTLIQALTTSDATARHVMNLETAVSVVAGYFYLKFATVAAQRADFDPARDVLPLRYLDWSVTTPMLLLALMLYLGHHGARRGVGWRAFLAVAALNYGMLAAGYAGETGVVADRRVAGAVGFACFAAMLAVIWATYAPSRAEPRALLAVFAALWAAYGGAYFMRDERAKAVAYNVLDVLSKAVLGMYMWTYFGRVISGA